MSRTTTAAPASASARLCAAALPTGGAGDQRDLAGEVGDDRGRGHGRHLPELCRTAGESGEPRLDRAAHRVYHCRRTALKPLPDGSVGISENSDGGIDRRAVALGERGGPRAGPEPHEPARRGGGGPARVGAHARRAPPLPARRAAPLPARGRGGAGGDRGTGGRRRRGPRRGGPPARSGRGTRRRRRPRRERSSRARPGHGAAGGRPTGRAGAGRRMRRASTCCQDGALRFCAAFGVPRWLTERLAAADTPAPVAAARDAAPPAAVRPGGGGVPRGALDGAGRSGGAALRRAGGRRAVRRAPRRDPAVARRAAHRRGVRRAARAHVADRSRIASSSARLSAIAGLTAACETDVRGG